MMNNKFDHYKTLQVYHEANQNVIDAAYRCLSKIYHPDRNQNVTEAEHMKSINIAYSVIGDPYKRKLYDLERSKSKNEFMHNKKHQAGLNDHAEHATKILEEFFKLTVSEEWEKAYHYLTSIDKTNVSLEDFLEWKKIVSSLYQLGNYKITCFKIHNQSDYAGVIYPKILQFSVMLTEMQLFTGMINHEYTQKYMALDQDCWHVCLGYTNLKPIIHKYKKIARSIPKTDKNEIILRAISRIDPFTGLLSAEGFREQAEREMYRSQRYGNPISLAVMSIFPLKGDYEEFKKNEAESCISYVAEILNRNIRKTDIISRISDNSFCILFTETSLEDARMALNKLISRVCSNEYLNYKIYSSCMVLVNGDIEKILKTALEKAAVRDSEYTVSRNEKNYF